MSAPDNITVTGGEVLAIIAAEQPSQEHRDAIAVAQEVLGPWVLMFSSAALALIIASQRAPGVVTHAIEHVLEHPALAVRPEAQMFGRELWFWTRISVTGGAIQFQTRHLDDTNIEMTAGVALSIVSTLFRQHAAEANKSLAELAHEYQGLIAANLTQFEA